MFKWSSSWRWVKLSCSAVFLTALTFASLSTTILKNTPAKAQEGFFGAFEGSHDCTAHILKAETSYQIPTGLLLAMALVESGREGRPYPWAVNIGGHGFYSPNKSEAVKAIRNHKGAFRPNTMVGCMQLSVYFHRKAFEPVDQIFDPEQNVFYAARYLKNRHDAFRSWTAAVRHYYGGTPEENTLYACKVSRTLAVLNKENVRLLKTGPCSRVRSASIAPEIKDIYSTKTEVLAQAQ